MLSCSTDRTYELPGSQLWAFLSSEKSRSPAMAILDEAVHLMLPTNKHNYVYYT